MAKEQPADDSDDLTDADLLALFVRDPFRMTPADYAELTDWQILHVLLAPRDDEHHLIPLKRRAAKAIGQAEPEWDYGKLPDWRELGIPAEAFTLDNRPSAAFVVMYFHRLLNHDFTMEQAMERWKAYVAKGLN